MKDYGIKDEATWQLKDIWLAFLFLGIGMLVAYLAWGNGFLQIVRSR